MTDIRSTPESRRAFAESVRADATAVERARCLALVRRILDSTSTGGHSVPVGDVLDCLSAIERGELPAMQ